MCNDTQDVLPPYFSVLGPGEGIDPRTPQSFIVMAMKILYVSRASCPWAMYSSPSTEGRISNRVGEGRSKEVSLTRLKYRHTWARCPCHERQSPPMLSDVIAIP